MSEISIGPEPHRSARRVLVAAILLLGILASVSGVGGPPQIYAQHGCPPATEPPPVGGVNLYSHVVDALVQYDVDDDSGDLILDSQEMVSIAVPHLNECTGFEWTGWNMSTYFIQLVGGYDRSAYPAAVGWAKYCDYSTNTTVRKFFMTAGHYVTSPRAGIDIMPDPAVAGDWFEGLVPEPGKRYVLKLALAKQGIIPYFVGNVFTEDGSASAGEKWASVPIDTAGAHMLLVGGRNYFTWSDMGVVGHHAPMFRLNDGFGGAPGVIRHLWVEDSDAHATGGTVRRIVTDPPRYTIHRSSGANGYGGQVYYQNYSGIHVAVTPTPIPTFPAGTPTPACMGWN